MSQRFARIEVRARDAEGAERLLAEAYAAGAAGCEQRDGEGSGTWILLYVEAGRAAAVSRALRAAGVDSEVGEPEPVAERDWAAAWREGLAAVVVSPRLVVRPSFVEHAAAAGQAVVVIDPAQAFGTGEHESTRLALELLDAWLPQAGPAPRVLDVGTGSGVLAVAARKLGAAAAFGFDLDPVASEVARENARRNGVGASVSIFTGPIAALGGGRFELVIANLLRRELLPIVGELAPRVAAGGFVLLAGLLEADREAVGEALAAVGLEPVEARTRRDARGDRWLGLVARAPAA